MGKPIPETNARVKVNKNLFIDFLPNGFEMYDANGKPLVQDDVHRNELLKCVAVRWPEEEPLQETNV